MRNDRSRRRSLLTSLDIQLHEVIRTLDLYVGLAGGVGALWLSLNHPAALAAGLNVASGLVSIIIGAVLAGLAILSAFMDQAFLRKLRAIGKQPIRYMSPFILTVLLGLWAAVSILVLSAIPTTSPTWIGHTAAFMAGMSTLYALASIIPDLKVMVDFIGLQMDASEIPDDFDRPD